MGTGPRRTALQLIMLSQPLRLLQEAPGRRVPLSEDGAGDFPFDGT